MNGDKREQTLARIDREIEALLREGRLSLLDYDIPFSQLAKTHRAANLKALLTARRHYFPQLPSAQIEQ